MTTVTAGAVERERESYTLENKSAVLLSSQKTKIRKQKDMMYLCNFVKSKII